MQILNHMIDSASIAIANGYVIGALKDMNRIDPLNGIYNRKSFDDFLLKEMERCKRYGFSVSLLLIDIDDFKGINQEFGLSSGDKVLKNLAKILKKNIRKIDIAARYGDDEFAVLLPHTKKTAALKVKSRIVSDIKLLRKKESFLAFTASIGLHSSGPEKIADLDKIANQNLMTQMGLKRK